RSTRPNDGIVLLAAGGSAIYVPLSTALRRGGRARVLLERLVEGHLGDEAGGAGDRAGRLQAREAEALGALVVQHVQMGLRDEGARSHPVQRRTQPRRLRRRVTLPAVLGDPEWLGLV